MFHPWGIRDQHILQDLSIHRTFVSEFTNSHKWREQSSMFSVLLALSDQILLSSGQDIIAPDRGYNIKGMRFHRQRAGSRRSVQRQQQRKQRLWITPEPFCCSSLYKLWKTALGFTYSSQSTNLENASKYFIGSSVLLRASTGRKVLPSCLINSQNVLVSLDGKFLCWKKRSSSVVQSEMQSIVSVSFRGWLKLRGWTGKTMNPHGW